ncbi:MAG TPA: MFS transporter [Cellulomonas sp.]
MAAATPGVAADGARGVRPAVDVRRGPRPRLSRPARAGLLLLVAVVVTQAATAAVLPATSRVLGLADWQAGAVTSCSAAVVVLTSAAWGRRAGRRGTAGVLLAGAVTGLLGTLGVAVVLAWSSTRADAGPGALGPGPGWVALLVTRGLVFGSAVAAVGPAVQVLLVAEAPTVADRVGRIARAGAARGVATMLGAGLAATLAATATVLPVLAAAIVLVVASVLLLLATRRRAAGPAGPTGPTGSGTAVTELLLDGAEPLRPSDLPPASSPSPGAGVLRTVRRPGVRAAVAASAAVFLALALVQGSVGFLVQDRYDLPPGRAAALTGALLVVAGLGSVLAQGVVVPRTGWAPWRLVRVGAGLAVVSMAAYALPVPVPVLVGVALVLGAGVGCAAAGCTSAASLAVGAEEQGGVAGLVNAVNALTFMVGPVLAATLYGLHGALPAVLALAASLGAVVTPAGVRR